MTSNIRNGRGTGLKSPKYHARVKTCRDAHALVRAVVNREEGVQTIRGSNTRRSEEMRESTSSKANKGDNQLAAG